MAAVFAIVERAPVHVHANEAVGELMVEIARELHSILERLLAMIQRVLNALPHRCSDLRHQLWTERALDSISPQRQWQPGFAVPPFAKVEDLLHARLPKRKLAFVDDQAGAEFPGFHLRNDLIEWHNGSFDVWLKQL